MKIKEQNRVSRLLSVQNMLKLCFGYFLYLVRCSWGHYWQTVFTLPAVSLLLLGYIDRANEVVNNFDSLCFRFAVAHFLAHLYPIDKGV